MSGLVVLEKVEQHTNRIEGEHSMSPRPNFKDGASQTL